MQFEAGVGGGRGACSLRLPASLIRFSGRVLQVELCPPERFVGVLTPGVCECGLAYKQDFCTRGGVKTSRTG